MERLRKIASLLLIPTSAALCAAEVGGLELARIHKDRVSHLENAGWGYDRYKHLGPLLPGQTQTILDATGPGVVKHIHITNMRTRMGSAGLQNRDDVILEIWFDDAATPAVRCPMTYFFCNADLNTPYIENGPGAWNSFFPMPFRKRARVLLFNEGPDRINYYSFVEWEKLPRWRKDLGYFHAAYERHVFQLTQATNRRMLELSGAGQLVGRYWRITTDEPLFRHWHALMEGNNEVDIDGDVRRLDYLGSEDSFNFSWGFQRPWFGLRAGIVENTTGALGLYRFHDPMPLRFRKSLTWTLNCQYEFFRDDPRFSAETAEKNDSHWVNYQSVFFWYQDSPGGYAHAPMPPLAERREDLLKRR